MRKASLETIAKKMRDLDLCMLLTQDGRHAVHARPMSNNGKVDYDGDSWFFTLEDTNKVRQVEASPHATLVFQNGDGLFIECYGRATIVRDRATLEEKWVPDLDRWFTKGLDTPGLCLLKISATRVHFWDKEEEGEYHA